ncbi:MAG: phage holin family protein [Candidatus Pacebacteria bacterium]|nr:phage holin family protein [Candidatus Paceibacterota bacterium]
MNITHWIISSIAIGIAAYLLPGAEVTLVGALVLAVVLGLINMVIRPIILLLTLPLTIVTLGLFSLVVNALLIMLADMIVPDFSVNGFWTALLFSLIVSVINTLFLAGARKSGV